MPKIDDVKAFARTAPHSYTAKVTERPIDSMIDAMIADLREEADMERSDVEESITRVELHRKGVSSIALRLGGGGFGHGPIPIPHTCHRTIGWCWPHPEDEDLEVCLWLEIPWPCPDGGFLG